MGNTCANMREIFDDKIAIEDEIAGRKRLSMNKKLSNFVKRTHALLCVALPECNRITSARDEASMHQQIVGVLDDLALHHHEELSDDERIQLLLKCVPDSEANFKLAVERYAEGAKFARVSRQDVDLIDIIELWYQADEDNSGELSPDEVRRLLFKMNISITPQGLEDLINHIDKNGDGQTQFSEFYKMYSILTTVAPVNALFDASCTRLSQARVTSAGEQLPIPVLSLYDIARFLRASQHMRFEDDEMARVVKHAFGEMRSIEGTYGVARRQFQNAILDAKRNSWLDPRHGVVTHDMSQPLHHYFVDSTHNTYLTGNQLTSASSASMYTDSLLDGCRCVEIDCWDGSDGKPIVTHGGTATTRISFREVIVAINAAAFRTSPYPVILSLELHTSPAQSDVLADTMREIFGNKLLTSKDAESVKANDPLFSPQGLQGKILCKGKHQPPTGIPRDAPDRDFSDDLNALFFLHGKKFASVGSTLKFPHYAIMSIDERRVEAWERETETYANINKVCFTRTYPKGSRVDSSNYNPVAAWNIGAQVVALNYQTKDFGMRLNRAKFMANGRSGYLLKPKCLRMKNVAPNTYGDRKKLTVTIICGVKLPRPRNSHKGEVIDPYVQVFISGVEGDDTSVKPKETSVVFNNGFNPTWNETFTFELNSVEMALLTLRVMEKDTISRDDFIAENNVSVSQLRLGYRAVPLYDEGMEPVPAPSCLFCHFELTDSYRDIVEADL